MPNDTNRFSWKARAKSFVYAAQGIKALFKTEHNARLHLVLTVLAVLLALLLKVSRIELLVLITVITMVWAAELFNTALEKAMDFMSTEKLPQIKIIKDMAAAAVLLTAVAAVAAGALIFIPKLLEYV